MEWIKMEKHIDECAKVFLRDQTQLFDEPVAYDIEEAKEFLEEYCDTDCAFDWNKLKSAMLWE